MPNIGVDLVGVGELQTKFLGGTVQSHVNGGEKKSRGFLCQPIGGALKRPPPDLRALPLIPVAYLAGESIFLINI